MARSLAIAASIVLPLRVPGLLLLGLWIESAAVAAPRRHIHLDAVGAGGRVEVFR